MGAELKVRNVGKLLELQVSDSSQSRCSLSTPVALIPGKVQIENIKMRFR